jgi:ACR3 family arsenite efflux pump ArsB
MRIALPGRRSQGCGAWLIEPLVEVSVLIGLVNVSLWIGRKYFAGPPLLEA